MLAYGPPIMQQDDRPQRHGEDHRPEVRRWHCEGGNAHHQQHRKRGVLRADDRSSEREHRPIGHDHAGLRQQVDPDEAVAGEIESDLGEPEGERRAEIGPELEFVPDCEHVRQVTGRPGVEERGHQ